MARTPVIGSSSAAVLTPRATGQVIVHGMKGVRLEGRKTNNRRTVTPGFFGDGVLRFQAIVDIDFERASALDLTDMLDETLSYLSSREPDAQHTSIVAGAATAVALPQSATVLRAL